MVIIQAMGKPGFKTEHLQYMCYKRLNLVSIAALVEKQYIPGIFQAAAKSESIHWYQLS